MPLIGLTIFFVLVGVAIMCLFFWFNQQLDSDTMSQGLGITGALTAIVAILSIFGAYKIRELELNHQEAIARIGNSELRIENNQLRLQLEESKKK